MSRAAPSFSSSEASFLAKSAWASAGRAATRGSTTLRQTEVLERVAGSTGRKSTQAVFSTQASSTPRLASARPCIPARPPMFEAHFSASRQSSTQSIDGVLMVAPSNRSRVTLPPLVMRNSLGIGQAGV